MKKKVKRGFTLVEIIVALAVFMIVMLGITGLLLSVINYTTINNRSFNSNSISRTVFESIRESRPTKPSNPDDFCGSFMATGIDNTDDVKTFVSAQLFMDGITPSTVSDPSKFSLCKSDGDRYSIGIKISWQPVGMVDSAEKGYYEIETWTWDNGKGDASEVNRKTYVTPR